ncbi:MAG: helix-turn-helix transcriptional regulator [Burkholderiales bacterium]|nr:helix-turn-helix transcriptional regulator [Burkholderiales bacterium]
MNAAPSPRIAARPARAPGAHALRVAHHLRGTSLNRALDVVGDWWTQRILRECFLGVRNFEAFRVNLAVPRQTLSARLKLLAGHGILDTAGGDYRLTACGRALFPWALMVWAWIAKWGGGDPRHPRELTHAGCGHAMHPRFACGACGAAVGLRDVEVRDAPGVRLLAAAASSGDRRWAAGRFLLTPREGAEHIAFVTADRWAHLILSAVFLGCRSFDVLARETGAATNILAHRLGVLVAAGFLVKRRAADDGRRFDYALTDRGRDVYPLTITLVQWADRWLPRKGGAPMLRIHRGCGAVLDARVVCSACGGELLPRDVTFTLPPAAPAPTRGDAHG